MGFRFFLSFCAFLVLSSVAVAHGFVVDDVFVDEKGADAVDAKNKGLEAARVKALTILLQRLFPEATAKVIEEMGRSVAPEAILSFRIVKEFLVADDWYRAVVSYTFDPEMIKSVGLAQEDGGKKGFMVIPVFYDVDGKVFVWESRWWQAWSEAAKDFIVPMGDLEDISAVDTEVLRRRDYKALTQMMSKYSADEVIFIEAHEGRGEVFVFIERPASEQIKKLHYYYRPENYENLSGLFTEVVGDVLKRILEGLYSPKVKILDNDFVTEGSGLLEDRYLAVPINQWKRIRQNVLSGGTPYRVEYLFWGGVIVETPKFHNSFSLKERLENSGFDCEEHDMGIVVLNPAEKKENSPLDALGLSDVLKKIGDSNPSKGSPEGHLSLLDAR